MDYIRDRKVQITCVSFIVFIVLGVIVGLYSLSKGKKDNDRCELTIDPPIFYKDDMKNAKGKASEEDRKSLVKMFGHIGYHWDDDDKPKYLELSSDKMMISFVEGKNFIVITLKSTVCDTKLIFHMDIRHQDNVSVDSVDVELPFPIAGHSRCHLKNHLTQFDHLKSFRFRCYDERIHRCYSHNGETVLANLIIDGFEFETQGKVEDHEKGEFTTTDKEITECELNRSR